MAKRTRARSRPTASFSGEVVDRSLRGESASPPASPTVDGLARPLPGATGAAATDGFGLSFWAGFSAGCWRASTPEPAARTARPAIKKAPATFNFERNMARTAPWAMATAAAEAKAPDRPDDAKVTQARIVASQSFSGTLAVAESARRADPIRAAVGANPRRERRSRSFPRARESRLLTVPSGQPRRRDASSIEHPSRSQSTTTDRAASGNRPSSSSRTGFRSTRPSFVRGEGIASTSSDSTSLLRPTCERTREATR